MGRNPLYLMLPVVISVQYAFMLPVATPPNAVAFSTGRIQVIDMVKPFSVFKSHLKPKWWMMNNLSTWWKTSFIIQCHMHVIYISISYWSNAIRRIYHMPCLHSPIHSTWVALCNSHRLSVIYSCKKNFASWRPMLPSSKLPPPYLAIIPRCTLHQTCSFIHKCFHIIPQ